MRDTASRIQRYRLSRYGSPDAPIGRRVGWLWPLLLAWGLWVGVLSEHSLLRLARLSGEQKRMQAQLASIQLELSRLDREMDDPRARRALGEKALRERSGWGRKDEIIYRIRGDAPDSLAP